MKLDENNKPKNFYTIEISLEEKVIVFERKHKELKTLFEDFPPKYLSDRTRKCDSQLT